MSDSAAVPVAAIAAIVAGVWFTNKRPPAIPSSAAAPPPTSTAAAPVRDTILSAYERAIAQLALRADSLEGRWRSFMGACYQGRATGSFDREWFALWEPRAMQGVLSQGCASELNDIRRLAKDIRREVGASGEAARRADVYPGTRRDALRKSRLDYAGQGKVGWVS